MSKPLQKLKAFIEKGARNSTNDAKMHQTIHDHSVALGAKCETDASEAADFSSGDVLTILSRAIKNQYKDVYSYPYINDLYDDYFVFSGNYDSQGFFKCDYLVDENGVVTLGTPIAVVRKVTYIEPTASTSVESGEVEIVGDQIPLIESVELNEASTRMLKLIAPGFGSSGYYSEEVLKRDGPQVFKKGLHNYIDHPTAQEEKAKPENSLNNLASVLTEDAKWLDKYVDKQGVDHGKGLYAAAKVQDGFNAFLNTFGTEIGTSIRASGKASVGEINGKKGPIIEAITSARSVDYVTVAGAGGKVLDLFESARKNVDIEIKEKGVTPMAEQPNTDALQESINKMNARFIRGEAKTYIARALTPLKVKEAIKERITANVIDCVPLTEAGEIDTAKFDETIKAAIENEMTYLSSVGGLGKISGFGESASKTPKTPVETLENVNKKLQEALTQL